MILVVNVIPMRFARKENATARKDILAMEKHVKKVGPSLQRAQYKACVVPRSFSPIIIILKLILIVTLSTLFHSFTKQKLCIISVKCDRIP